MIKHALRLLVAAIPITFPILHAEPKWQQNDTLQRYIQLPDPVKEPVRLIRMVRDSRNQVARYEYTLTSQHWSGPDNAQADKPWQHVFNIYRPNIVSHDTALLYVNGGTRTPVSKGTNAPPAQLDFARMANETHSIVIDLQDVPNQYLTFRDGKPRREDDIVAYTWRNFLDHPSEETTSPLYLPMTKSVVRAMDAAQEIASTQWGIQLKHFVVSGASKRGWTTWLSALVDERVSGIVPVVIDILDTKQSIQHIYRRYICTWPPAFQDYVAQGITNRLATPEFDSLMKIVDPLAYLQGPQSEYYKKRLSIPKYIISASGDDFFVPDSLTEFLEKLPGETRIRVVPNQSHYIDMKIVEEALLAWYKGMLSGALNPLVEWEFTLSGRISVVTAGQKPAAVRLWQANAENCDFRKNAGVKYHSRRLSGRCNDSGFCRYPVKLDKIENGCQANFVEAEFDNLIETTPVIVDESPAIADAMKSCLARNPGFCSSSFFKPEKSSANVSKTADLSGSYWKFKRK